MASGKGFIAYEAGAEIAIAVPKAMTVDGLQLGANGVIASVARAHVTDILGATDFGIDLTLKADVKGTAGELFRLHESFIAAVDSKGELSFSAFTTEGMVKIVTKGGLLSNGATHNISIDLSDGQLQVIVDGKLAGSAAMQGTLLSSGTHNLTFGNPWGKTNFVGDLKAFEIVKDGEDFHPVAQTTIISNPFQTLASVSAKLGASKMSVDIADSDAMAHRTHPVFDKIFQDQAHHDAPLAAQRQSGLPDLGDRFEFLAHHVPDMVLA